MNCPRCNTQLLMSDKNGVEIDYCPDCRGLWLDKGELEKIIEKEYASNSQRNRFDDDDDDNHRNHNSNNFNNQRNKKRGFLENLFDF